MQTQAEQSHVRIFISARVSLSQEEKEFLVHYCSRLGQLGTRLYHFYNQSEVTDEETEGTGFYGDAARTYTRIRVALPDNFKAPYHLERNLAPGVKPMVFQSLLQLACFLASHEIGHRDFPINDEKVRERHERICEALAIRLVDDLGDDVVRPPQPLLAPDQ